MDDDFGNELVEAPFTTPEPVTFPDALVPEDFIPRKFWGPLMPSYAPRVQTPVSYVITGYCKKNYFGKSKESPGPRPDQDACCKEMAYILTGEYLKHLPDIRYNFMVCGASPVDVYEGRGWTRQPQLPVKYRQLSSQAMFVGIIGDFTDRDPGEKIFEKIEKLLQFAVQNNYLKPQFTRIDLANPFKKKAEVKPTSNYLSSIYL